MEVSAQGQQGSVGLSELVARLAAGEVSVAEFEELAGDPDAENALAAEVGRLRGEVESLRAWCEGLESRQARLEALLEVRLAARRGGSGSG